MSALNLAENIIRLRHDKKITQEQLADRLKAMPAIQLVKAEVMLAAPCTLSCSWYSYKYRYKR